jgi:3-vinyl bacteriochlorophyllide hydratase
MPHADFGRSPAKAFFAHANAWIDQIAPCPWQASVGARPRNARMDSSGAMDRGFIAARAQTQPPARTTQSARRALYTPEERARRDASAWTVVQGVLAPIQFVVFLVSVGLIAHWMTTGQDYGLAVGSVVIKTITLYTIMVTGSIWEKVVFGKWLFAPAFFWEDVFSMLVLALHSAYLIAIAFHIGDAGAQMTLALLAYATYLINAGQYLWKLRQARLEKQHGGDASQYEGAGPAGAVG